MRKIIFLLTCTFLLSFHLLGQAPLKFNYQAVARDNTGAVIKNQNVSLRMSIRSGSTNGVNEYVETFSVTTNDFGLMNLEIGSGTPVLGSMANIDWGKTTYFIAVEMDASGGSNYQLMGVSQLLSVPYALYAEKSGSSGDGDTSSTNELQALSRTGNTVYLSKSGGSFIDQVNYNDADSLNELQNISIADHDLTISSGNTVTIPDNVDDADADSTNELQNLSISGNDITISKGNTITVPDNVIDDDADSTNELQSISLSNDTIYLSSGGSIKIGSNPNFNILYPDGFSNDVVLIFEGQSYTVPNNKTLYLKCQSTNNQYNPHIVSGSDTFHLHGNGIFKENTTIKLVNPSASYHYYMTGFLADKKTAIVYWNTSNSYTVPTGKILILLSDSRIFINNSSDSYVIGGQAPVYGLFPENTKLQYKFQNYGYPILTGYLLNK
jgi:hypothetical protein